MTNEQQSIERVNPEGDERFLPASSPWLARYFRNAATLLGELQEATDLSDFSPDCIDDDALGGFIDRLTKAWVGLPDEQNEDEECDGGACSVLVSCAWFFVLSVRSVPFSVSLCSPTPH